MQQVWPAIVVGAGAAGFMAAIFAARRGVRVLLLETRPRPGAKIRVSGGGRCNILPSVVTLDRFHTTGSMNVVRNVLQSWPLADVRRWFEDELGIPLKVEPSGKVFPHSDRAQDVVNALLEECSRAGVVLQGEQRVLDVRRDGSDAPFELRAASGERFACRQLVLATGGLSLPKSGSDGGGLTMACALGHVLVPTYPALVPLRTPEKRWSELAGIALGVRLQALRNGLRLEQRDGDFLFTHRGFSGPVILDLSRHVCAPDGASVQLKLAWLGKSTPDWQKLLQSGGAKSVANCLREHLPARLATLLVELAHVPAERKLAELRRDERTRLQEYLVACELPISGNEGYATAEVTGGGIPLAEISHQTLESRLVPRLYFAGEMLDVVGHIGGYNFLWAWASGRKVGQSLVNAS